ncbi:MAG: hypothetical protein ABIU05_20865 [Nitrospirales bacterium]
MCRKQELETYRYLSTLCLSIRKGTQTGWYLQVAQQARDEVQALNPSYQAAVTAAKERLSAAGLEQLKPLCARLADAVLVARDIVVEMRRYAKH